MHNLVCNELENGGPLHVVGEDEAAEAGTITMSLILNQVYSYLVSEEYPDDVNEKLSGNFW